MHFLKPAVAIASLANQSCKACSGWVFAAVEKVFQWNYPAWSDAISADSDGCGAIEQPLEMIKSIGRSHTQTQTQTQYIKSNVYIPNQAFPFQTPDSLSGWGAQLWWVRCNSWTIWPPRSITNKKWWFFRPYQSMKKGLLFPLNLQLGSEYTRDILAWLRSRELSAPDCRQKVFLSHFTMRRTFSVYLTQLYDL